MHNSESRPFGKLRSLFFPVYRHEFKLFVPLLLIFFLICFNYNVLRAAKDSLVISAPSSGAEVIPYLKVWAILPMAFGVTYLFTKLSNRFRMDQVFYIMTGSFLAFFLLFATVLYPLRESLHPTTFADHLEKFLPLGCKGFVAMIRNWTYTTFYVMAELWGTAIMTMLFWAIANEMFTVHTAKRFYILILIGGNLSAIAAGTTSNFISSWGLYLAQKGSQDPWQLSLYLLVTLLSISGIAFLTLFRSVMKGQEAKKTFQPHHKETRPKLSLKETFRYLASSKYLLCIGIIVVTYNICINLTEVAWKDQLFHLHPNPSELNAYLGSINISIGTIATIVSLFSATLIRKWSWSANALVPPLIVLVTGIGFFSFLLLRETGVGFAAAAALGTTPVALSAFFGSVQQSFSRASKYTLFDATKEIAFIPLSKESKLKGKAVIDGIGSRFGKSGGALIYQMLLLFLDAIPFTIPYISTILLFLIGAWIIAVLSLGRQFDSLNARHEKVILADEKSPVIQEEPSTVS